MQLSDDDLREFAKMWETTFHEQISLDDARQCASEVMVIYSLIVKADQFKDVLEPEGR